MTYYQESKGNPVQGFSKVGRGRVGGKKTDMDKLVEAKIATCARFIHDLQKGYIPAYYLRETIMPSSVRMCKEIASKGYELMFTFSESQTTSDFPLLTGRVLDRMLLANFLEFPAPWREIARVSTLRDFRTVDRIAFDGIEDVWPVVHEKEELDYKAGSETGYSYAPKKYACASMISWEALLNDDLDAFSTIPARLGRGGSRTILRFFTELHALNTTSGDLYFNKATNDNIVDANPSFSIEGLSQAMTKLWQKTDTDGQPIFISGTKLEYPPALHVAVQNVLNSLQVEATGRGGFVDSSAPNPEQRIIVNNWMSAGITPVLNPYLPVLDTTTGDTAWYLWADPAESRPGIELGFIRGFESPALFQKGGDSVRIGAAGTAIDQGLGDFSTMCIEYKGVLAFGGTTLDPRVAVASRGTDVAEP